MEYALLQEMHHNLEKYIEQGLFENRFVVIFGSNEPAERMTQYLRSKGILVNGLIDNNKKKEGTVLEGITVATPEKLLIPKIDNALILIASRYYAEMVVQLSNMGYEEEIAIRKVVEFSSYSVHSVTEEEFEKHYQVVQRGENIFKRFEQKNPELQKVFVCPLVELGAAYVGLSFLYQYVKEQEITQYIILMTNRACSKIAYLFGQEAKVQTISKAEMEDFLQYAVFSSMGEGKILVLNHRFPYTCRIGEIGNYKNIKFVDHYRYSVFGLEEHTKPEIPYIHRGDEKSMQYVDAFFEKHGLQKGRTVILLPYANTAPLMDGHFWEKLVTTLTEKGYQVCTNSSGESEPAIQGTQAVFFDLRYALEIVETAGMLIGLRSGLCDVLCSAKTKKIIIYPDRVYGPNTFMQFYNFVENEMCEDAVELLWHADVEYMVGEVLDYI